MSATTTLRSTRTSHDLPRPPLDQETDTVYRRRWLTLGVLSLSLLVIVVDTTIVNVAIPTLSAQLHAGATALEWIIDSYTLVFAALLLPAGNLGDRYGRHRALAVGMAVFGAASLGAALSSSAAELIAWRAVMGAGAALVTPATMAILTSVFTDAAERAKAIGIWSAMSGLGVAIGPTAGGWLLAHYSWSAIFAVNLPIVALAMIGGRFLVPPSMAPHRTRFDLVGIVLAVFAFGMLTYAVIEAGSAGWTSAPTLVRGAVSAALLVAFAAWERHTDHPMVDLSLFRNPGFTAASAAIMILFFGLAGATFVLTQILQFVLGYSPLAAGVRSLPAALALAVGAPVGTRLAGRFGIRVTVTAGLITAAAGLGVFALATGQSGYVHYLIASTIMTAGIGLTMAPATQSIMASLPPAKAGIGSAVNNATRNLGTVLGVAIVGSIAATIYRHDMAATNGVPAIARDSVGAAAQIAQRLQGTHAAGAAHTLQAMAADAFVHGAALGTLIAAAVALVTAAATARFLPARAASA
ncbi:MAG TPA: DHA2 family efflux MFS transporter permease subunit [Streptosporangiaceae bacterium]